MTNKIKPNNRLNIMMKALDISGKDLSKIIHVDDSLISKWRCGKRSLKTNSIYLKKITDTFLSLDKSNNYSNIKKLLVEEYDDIHSCNEEEIEIYLKTWLSLEGKSEQDKLELFEALKYDDDVDVTMMYHFHGNGGRRKASQYFKDYLIQLNEPTEILSFTTEDGTWFSEDDEYMRVTVKKQLELIEMGYTYNVIHPVNRSYEQIANSLYSWLQVHVTGKTIAHYIPDYSNDMIRYSFIIVPGRIVYFGISSANYGKELETWLSNDVYLLDTITKIMKESLASSERLFDRYNYSSRSEYNKELLTIMQQKGDRYYHGTVPQYLPLTDASIKKIFKENDIDKELSEEYMKLYKKVTAMNVDSRNVHLIDLKNLKRLLANDEVEMQVLSFLFGRKIIASKKLYRELLIEIFRSAKETSTSEVGLLDEQRSEALEAVSVYLQENTAIQFVGARPNQDFVLILKEVTSVVGIMDKLKSYKKSIPPIMKDKEHIYKIIKKLLAENK